MTEIVERVAEAIRYATSARGLDSDMWRNDAEFIARAAIEAMREPTEAMLDAVDAGGRDYFGGETAERYSKMIDAAVGSQ